MRVCGIVAEYNPFHTGHLYHLQETRRVLGENTVLVCAMSGNFVQRGDFAVLEKYARAETAIRCGADLVVELPLSAALSSAEGFALGAIQTLHALGCDSVSFGAETSDITLLCRAADGLRRLRRVGISGGSSYAAQRQAALQTIDPEAATLLSFPNNTLGIAYCQFARPLGMQVFAVPRQGAGHDETAPQGGFVSASYLRERLRGNQWEECVPYLPEAVWNVLQRARQYGQAPVCLPEEELFYLVQRLSFTRELYTGTADGFDERLQKAIAFASSWRDIVTRAQTRRFPAARIRRALLRAVLTLTPDTSVTPSYIRIIALGQRGRNCIKRATLPVIVKPATEKIMATTLQPALRRDAFADTFFTLAMPDKSQRAAGGHFRQTPFIGW